MEGPIKSPWWLPVRNIENPSFGVKFLPCQIPGDPGIQERIRDIVVWGVPWQGKKKITCLLF